MEQAIVSVQGYTSIFLQKTRPEFASSLLPTQQWSGCLTARLPPWLVSLHFLTEDFKHCVYFYCLDLLPSVLPSSDPLHFFFLMQITSSWLLTTSSVLRRSASYVRILLHSQLSLSSPLSLQSLSPFSPMARFQVALFSPLLLRIT